MQKWPITLISLALLTAGCWQSDRPLIPDAEADSPPQAEGTYSIRDGNFFSPQKVRISKEAGGYYRQETTNTAGGLDIARVRFDKLRDRWFLAQTQTLAGNGTYSAPTYGLVLDDDGEIEQYDIACDRSDLVFEGVSHDDPHCKFTTYKGLRAAAESRLDRHMKGEIAVLSVEQLYRREN